MLLPASPAEIYEMAIQAFDLAERLQTPVFVMSDLDLGMNTWMSEPFEYPTAPPDRGKRLDEETLARLRDWGRYRDVDGDGIPYRTVPGDGMPAYFCRGSGHDERASYSERPADYVTNVDRLRRKFETARSLVPLPLIDYEPGARAGLIAFGTSHWAAVESRTHLRSEAGLAASYMRVRAWPFTDEVAEFVDRHERVYVIEQNRDGQMRSLLALDLGGERAAKLRSVLHYDGLPIDARSITKQVLAEEQQEAV